MDWEGLREATLGDVATTLVSEGGGTAAGFMGGAAIGRQIQNVVKPDSEIVTSMDKLKAWGGNNVPKLALWWLARGYRPGGVLGEATNDARKALAGSVVFDTVMRLANAGKNPATASLWGYQILGQDSGSARGDGGNVQHVLQENSALRSELNKALQRLADMQVPGSEQYRQIYPRGLEQSGLQPITPEVAERQRKFQAMEHERLQATPPAIQERERKYAFAGFKENSENTLAALCGFKER